jgi:hypothetical protein
LSIYEKSNLQDVARAQTRLKHVHVIFAYLLHARLYYNTVIIIGTWRGSTS